MMRVILYYTAEMLCCPHLWVGNWGTAFLPSFQSSCRLMAQEAGESPKPSPWTWGPPSSSSLHPCLCEWAAQPCRPLQHFRWCLQYQHPLACSSRRHRANRLRKKKDPVATPTPCSRLVLWKMKERDCPTQPWVCSWSTLLLASTHCRHLPYSEFSSDKIHEIIFSLSLHDVAKAPFPLLHLDCQFYQSNPSFTQSTAGNLYFFEQSSPSLSVWAETCCHFSGAIKRSQSIILLLW